MIEVGVGVGVTSGLVVMIGAGVGVAHKCLNCCFQMLPHLRPRGGQPIGAGIATHTCTHGWAQVERSRYAVVSATAVVGALGVPFRGVVYRIGGVDYGHLGVLGVQLRLALAPRLELALWQRLGMV